MKLRIYREADAGPNASPVATVTIGTSLNRELSPAHFDESARYFLEGIETNDADVRERLKTALARETVPVSRALVATRGAVRTRGDTTVPEPYGTPAYWRAALGRLSFEAGLSCDPDDYKNLLVWVEPPVVAPLSAAAAAPSTPSSEPGPDLRGKLIALIDSFLPPRPQLAVVRTRGDTRTRGVPDPGRELLELLRRELEDDPEFLLVTAKLRLALSLPEEERETILAAFEALATRVKSHGPQMEAADVAPATAPVSHAVTESLAQSVTGFKEMLDHLIHQLGLGARPRLVTRGPTARSAAPPIDPEPLAQRLRDDPEFLRAVFQLQQALNHPQLRLLLPEALEAFAREAASREAEPD